MAEFDAILVRDAGLTPVTRGVRASLDAGGRRAESMDMEDRIAVLEKDVHAIKSDLAVIRRDHADAKEVSGRLHRVEVELVAVRSNVARQQKDVSQLQKDVSQLQKDVSQLQKDVSQLQKDVSQLMGDVTHLKDETVLIRIELMRLSTVQAECATKAEMKALDANIKGWMLVITLSIMTSVFAMIYPLYGLLKPAVAVRPAQTQTLVAPISPPPADSK